MSKSLIHGSNAGTKEFPQSPPFAKIIKSYMLAKASLVKEQERLGLLKNSADDYKYVNQSRDKYLQMIYDND